MIRNSLCSVVISLCMIVIPADVDAQNWTRAPELPSTYVTALAEQSGDLYAITDSVIYRSTNAGSSWEAAPAQPPSTALSALFARDASLFVGTRGDGAFRSLDGGTSWQSFGSGLAGTGIRIVQFAARGDSLYAGTDGSGVYVLNLLNPVAWIPYNNGLFQFGTSALIASGSTLVACVGQYVFVRPAGASQWTDAVIDSLLNDTPISLFRADSFLYLGTSGGVFRGDTGGFAWKKTDIRQFAGREIVAFAAAGPRVLAALWYNNNHWIFSTEDDGATWDVRAHEFASVFALLTSGGRLWAGRSDGLWWYDMSFWTGLDETADLPQSTLLHQSYPNPFNPSATISFSLPVRTFVSLEIYDMLGKHVATIASEALPAGRHARQWLAGDAPSGAYFYRLRAGEAMHTGKLLLLR